MRFRVLAARLAFGGFVLAAAIALTASIGTRSGQWNYETGFRILAPGVAIGLLAVLAGAVWLIGALRDNDSKGWRFGFAGLVGALIVVAIPLSTALQAWGAPPIHDISTDVEYAPPFEALLPLRAGAPNGPEYDGPKRVMLNGKLTTVAQLQKKSYPLLIAKRQLAVTVAKLYWHAFETAKRMGWTIVAFDPKRGRIEATDTTLWFGFTDDIVIRVLPAGSMGARLDIRSKSRVGTTDYGRDAARVKAYLKAL